MTGVIKTKTDKNFGFIEVEGGDDVFFHASVLVDITFEELKEGDEVTFDVEEGPKGKAAVNLKKV